MVERLGRYRKTLKPGLTLIVPFVDRISYRVNMREQKLTVGFENMPTKDGAVVFSAVDLYMSVRDSHKMAYESTYMNEAIGSWCERQMKNLVKSMSTDAVLADVEDLEQALLESVKQHEAVWGIEVNTLDIRKIRSV